MTRFLALILAIALGSGAAAAGAAPAVEHLRGTLLSVTASTVVLRTADGATETLAIGPGTSYALAAKSSLNAILPGSYIGTAAKGSGADMVALEVVVFPPALRGIGEGHYPWDPLPDITKPGGSSASSMTNGSVSGVAIAPVKTASSMTDRKSVV